MSLSRFASRAGFVVLSMAIVVGCKGQPLSFTPLSKTVVWQGPSNVIPSWKGGGFITLDQPVAAMTVASATSPDSMVYIFAGGVSTTLAVKIPGAVFTQNLGIARGKQRHNRRLWNR
jgi:hypothetical protein